MADFIFQPPDPAKSGDMGGGPAPGAAPDTGAKDPTLVTGQDPDSFLGIAFPMGTGAGGTPAPGGQSAGSAEPTAQPNQYPPTEPISGVNLSGTGAPGTQGAPKQLENPGPLIAVTDPNYTAGKPGGGSGTQMVSVPVAVGGASDSTAQPGQYPPAAPIVPGDYYPTQDGAGKGSVMVGGWKKGARG